MSTHPAPGWPAVSLQQPPVRYQVASNHAETPDTVTLTLESVDQPLATHRPGQFTMMYAFGIGEVPISVSGAPGGTTLMQTIRAVGAVTTALCSAVPGQVIGLRGPYGTDWDVASAAGRDLLIVAGGIGLAPLRPALLAALADRDAYRRITVLIGSRSPTELVFAKEPARWREHGASVHVTVDRAEAGWNGNVGLVTQLLERADVDPAGTVALVCGPEVMMRLTARALLAAGIPASDIRISLERNMRCGVAECGHCQLGPLLLCRDGPVVSYARAAPLLAIKNL